MLKTKLIVSSALCLFMASCSSGGDGAGSTIGSLPNNTDPVVDNSLSAQAIGALEAVTGLKLSAWSDTANWQSGNSRPMCEVGQVLKESLSEAMNPDKIKCYVGAVSANSDLNLPTDGSEVNMKLINFPENQDMQPRIKMKITNGSNGLIKRFEMWSCFDFDGTNYAQSEYILQTINPDDLSVSSYTKHTGSHGAESYGGASTVTGTLNSSYEWLSKSMALQRYHGGGGGSFSQDLNVTQEVSSFVISGYNAGSWGQDIFSNAFYASVQGLNMSSPKNLALGDGSAKFNLDWCHDSTPNGDCADEGGSDVHTDSGIESWNGDTRINLVTAADGDHHSKVAAATVPAVSSISAITFSGGEVWDCSASSFDEADLSDMEKPETSLGAAFAACDAKYDYRDETSGGYACDAAQ